MHSTMKLLLKSLSIAGLNPYKNNWLSKLLAFVTITSVSGILLLNVLKLLLDWHGIRTIGEAHMISSVVMLFAKIVYLIIYKPQLINLIKTSDIFWDFNKFDKSSEQRLNAMREFQMKTIYYFFILGTVTTIFMVIGSYRKREMFFPGYDICDLQSHHCFNVQFCWQVFFLYLECMPIVISFDGLFVCLIGRAYYGLELLQVGLKQLILVSRNRNEDDLAVTNLRQIINEHDRILRFMKKLNAFYSPVMLLHSLSSLFSLVFCLYMLTVDGFPPEFSVLITFTNLAVTVCCQFFIFCYAGTKILDQSTDMVYHFYDVDWWAKTQPDFRRALVLMIQRAQRTQKLKIGELQDLNLESFLNVMRNGVSLFALIRTMSGSERIMALNN